MPVQLRKTNDTNKPRAKRPPEAIRLLLQAFARGDLVEEVEWEDLDAAHYAAVEQYPAAAKNARIQAKREFRAS